jgi:DNA-directed RNA polymerase subunit RPC12/RpoP
MDDLNSEFKVVKTEGDSRDGQTKCPKCGATDLSLNPKTGKLRCNFCRHEFEPEKVEGLVTDIENLKGTVIGSGAQSIEDDSESIITLKCSSCGAEVVIDTSEVTQARCHWCRNTLSITQKVPNGAVPDIVLPFKLKKEEARQKIEEFVGKRKFYAHPAFRREFTTENIMGVYLPYMVVDINGHSDLIGEGEHQTRRYTVKHGDHETTYYDADLYHVERDFDITIEGLTIESSVDKLKNDSQKTNNIINSIMPFDIENGVKWDANYLRGYTSEKRDTNIEQLSGLVEAQAKDIARFQANDTLGHYDRGVCWQSESMHIKGQQWKAAYLPVWLYSYMQKKGAKKGLLHYVAVNARTNETMGSVPIHIPKLAFISFLIEVACFFTGNYVNEIFDTDYGWITLIGGVGYYIYIYNKYRNTGARHYHEKETKASTKNMIQKDDFIKHRHGLTNSRITGANNTSISSKNNVLGNLGDMIK